RRDLQHHHQRQGTHGALWTASEGGRPLGHRGVGPRSATQPERPDRRRSRTLSCRAGGQAMSTATLVQQPVALNGQAKAIQPTTLADAVTVSATQVNRALCITAGVTAVLVVIGLAGASALEIQFAFSYLTAFTFAVSIAIGSLFWIMIHHLTSASWSV